MIMDKAVEMESHTVIRSVCREYVKDEVVAIKNVDRINYILYIIISKTFSLVEPPW